MRSVHVCFDEPSANSDPDLALATTVTSVEAAPLAGVTVTSFCVSFAPSVTSVPCTVYEATFGLANTVTLSPSAPGRSVRRGAVRPETTGDTVAADDATTAPVPSTRFSVYEPAVASVTVHVRVADVAALAVRHVLDSEASVVSDTPPDASERR